MASSYCNKAVLVRQYVEHTKFWLKHTNNIVTRFYAQNTLCADGKKTKRIKLWITAVLEKTLQVQLKCILL